MWRQRAPKESSRGMVKRITAMKGGNPVFQKHGSLLDGIRVFSF